MTVLLVLFGIGLVGSILDPPPEPNSKSQAQQFNPKALSSDGRKVYDYAVERCKDFVGRVRQG